MTSPSIPGRRGRVVPLILASTSAIALGLSIYLSVAAHSWQRSSDDWEELARAHGTEVAQTQADLDAAHTELQATRDQLGAAQQRITELADEKAQLGDETEAQKQLADYQETIGEAAATVASSLAECVTAQDELIGYLDQKDLYDPVSLAGFGDQVQLLCAEATDANLQLQKELNQ